MCFPLVPESRCFNMSIRNDFLRKVDYSSDYNRLNSFVTNVNFTVLRLELEYNLLSQTLQNQSLGLIIKYRALWKGASFFIGFLQNLFLLLQNLLEFDTYSYLCDAARTGQYIAAALLFIIYLFQSVPLRLVLADIRIENRHYKNRMMIQLTKVYFLLSDKTFIYCFAYALITAIGTYYPIVLPLLLLDFFYRFTSTKFLMQMIVKPIGSLTANVAFLVLIIYIHVFT